MGTGTQPRLVRPRGTGRARRQRLLGITAAVLSALAVVFYIWSAAAYRSSIDTAFAMPPKRSDGVAVVLVPKAINADAESMEVEVAIFPGQDLIDADGRLVRAISIDLYPSVGAGTITYPSDTTPSPQSVTLPATGLVERYPFDNYTMRVRVRVSQGDVSTEGTATGPLPMSLSVAFNVPGWDYTATQTPDGFVTPQASVAGTVQRSVSTMTIAVVFIALILVFGILAAALVALGVRGRFVFEMSTAAWLTSAIFALVSLRNGFPGNPPLGSWMDVLVYFWVIAVLMASITIAVTALLLRSAAKRAGK